MDAERFSVRTSEVRQNPLLAHEDHAQRACYAALHLSDRLRRYADAMRIDPGVNFSFRNRRSAAAVRAYGRNRLG
jgi:hypothetical protein